MKNSDGKRPKTFGILRDEAEGIAREAIALLQERDSSNGNFVTISLRGAEIYVGDEICRSEIAILLLKPSKVGNLMHMIFTSGAMIIINLDQESSIKYDPGLRKGLIECSVSLVVSDAEGNDQILEFDHITEKRISFNICTLNKDKQEYLDQLLYLLREIMKTNQT